MSEHYFSSSPAPFQDFIYRPRRNRQSAAIRGLVQETYLQPHQLIAPLFVVEGEKEKQPIDAMPAVFRFSNDQLLHEVENLLSVGIQTVDLFFRIAPAKKDAEASEAVRPDNLLQQTVRLLKKEFPSLCVMVDIALDPFTNHGHDGLVNRSGEIDNDSTLVVLGEMSLRAAEAGADFIAPSDMMDGRVGYLRKILNDNHFISVGILSYAAKYASAFYGPFRDALGSAPQFGDKKTYQMNPANVREAILECQMDEKEGADLLLIKPALPYLDVISKVKASTLLPLGAYHVSGEYAMVMAAAQKGWIDPDRIFLESLVSIKRAGADFILTYAAERVARLL